MEENKVTDAYIRERYGNLPQKNVTSVKKAMAKYGANFWWESEDPIEVAKYQLFEDILLVDFSKFHEGIERLLDRPVWTHEFGLSVDALREEARVAIKRVQKGIGVSDEYRETAVRKSIQSLEDFCKRNGKNFLKIELLEKPEQDENGIDQTGYDGFLK